MATECPNCHKPVSPKLRFCPECGAPIPVEKTVGTTAAMPQSVPTKPESSTAIPAEAPSVPSSRVENATKAPNAATAPVTAQAPAPVEDKKGPEAHGIADRAVELPSVPPAPPGEAFGDAPFQFAIYFQHIMVSGHPSFVQFRLVNTGIEAFGNVTIEIKTKGFARVVTKRLGRIAAGVAKSQPIEVEPATSGHYILNIAVSFEISGQRKRYCGNIPQNILAVPEEKNFSVVIKDIQSSSGGGSNANLGAQYGNINFSNVLDPSKIKTLNDLLEFKYPEYFQPVSMDPDESDQDEISDDYEAGEKRLTIPSIFIGGSNPGAVCVLASTGDDAREIRLVRRDEFRLGRSRADSDYVTWCWPRSAEKDQHTKFISKLHTALVLNDKEMMVFDNATVNGTKIDGAAVGNKSNPTAFQGRARIRLGDEYEIDVEHLSSDKSKNPCIENERRWIGQSRYAPKMLGAVRFTPIDNEVPPYTAVWLFTDCPFGAGDSNGIVIKDPSLDEIQGSFRFYRGSFWLENDVENDAVVINGHKLASDAIVPLTTGMTLKLGESQWHVEIKP